MEENIKSFHRLAYGLMNKSLLDFASEHLKEVEENKLNEGQIYRLAGSLANVYQAAIEVTWYDLELETLEGLGWGSFEELYPDEEIDAIFKKLAYAILKLNHLFNKFTEAEYKELLEASTGTEVDFLREFMLGRSIKQVVAETFNLYDLKPSDWCIEAPVSNNEFMKLKLKLENSEVWEMLIEAEFPNFNFEREF